MSKPFQPVGTALPNVPLGNYDVPSGWPTSVKFNEPGDVPGPPVQFESEDMGDPGAGYGFESDHTYEGDWFFFHSDHLGSTSYLTDTAGNVSQFVWYAPYGEALVDEHTTTYENPFKFSGKELDDITGLYDHGARNRNPITAVWYGIDELFEKYPENGPYGYCGGNPVRYFDPDGRDRYIFNEDGTFARVIYKEEGEHYGYIEGKNIKFKFADPENDPQLVESVNFQEIHFVTDEEIDNALWNSGVYNKTNRENKYSYAQDQSSVANPKGQGKMDYRFTAVFERGAEQKTLDYTDLEHYEEPLSDYTIYLTKIENDYVAHNSYNYGNFLWGAGMNALGFYELTAKAGAHWNNFFNDKEPFKLDSDDDQNSIHLGFK